MADLSGTAVKREPEKGPASALDTTGDLPHIYDTVSVETPGPFETSEKKVDKEGADTEGDSGEFTDVLVEDDSPYPEVRAAVPSFDDTTMLQNTVRMWTIGLLMTTIGSAVNMLFSMHAPSMAVSTFVTSMLAWPLGRFWARWVPNVRIFGRFGGPFLNPGPFSLKEHALITVMGNISFGGGAAYATDILLSMNMFYKRDYGWLFDLLAIWSTQCIGFSLAGLCYKILITPPLMIWPSTLVQCTFLSNIHIHNNKVANGWKVSRLKFFMIIFIAGFIYYWLPGYLFQALSSFAWVTWIAPKNVVVNQIFGSSTGLGLLPITFDWNQIAGYVGSPLVPPISAIFTILCSMVTIFWIVVPIVHYSNTWYGNYVPISDSTSMDRFQQRYNVTKVVNQRLSLDLEAYHSYSRLYLPTTFAISYGMSFASVMATISHTACFHWRTIYNGVRNINTQDRDVHARLMERYKAPPYWWYLVTFFVFLALSIATVRAWDTQLPVWALFLALAIAGFFLLPVGIIYALTNMAVGLNVITEFIIGYMLPGRPIAMMFFKTFGYITNSQAITFAQDMKLGHYLKVAPKLMFTAQFIATIWGSTVQIAVLRWSEANIKGLCTKAQPGHFTCPGATVFFTASIIWGVIGPQRMFSAGQMYSSLNYFFVLGFFLPIVNWLILSKWPKRFEKSGRGLKFVAKYLSWPVFFSGTGLIPPATPYNYGSYCIVGIFFGYFIKRYYFQWWCKYNYSLSAALDIGLAWGALIIFFSTGIAVRKAPVWWGNTVIDTLDTNGQAIKYILQEGEYFDRASP
ncbi:ABR156Wp [Eremothecium gossypii ATCC 10895]|uniref:ABR156Wp n=1 Tax=Eremothecium gossypii (strain ATCC 10895 / CBS 109.51 / FGSC 9923 / NRRL Y-1056) TaxID=284811 RepID=Q75D67_EREGS|nr:ABR156Wp [Eremothecium gossypii ATCC 10895]AAS50928.2 ABR156Wp [Eremothecium gossypii ATCC 10895]AEY95217.1 FABR156Wp [Eremothecium gossypii FDAG1]